MWEGRVERTMCRVGGVTWWSGPCRGLRGLPGGADHAGQQRPLLLQSELHHPRSLKLLSDPLALLQVVDEHELHPDVLTVRHLGNTGEQSHLRHLRS